MTKSGENPEHPGEPGSSRSGGKISIIRPDLMRMAVTEHCNMATSEGGGVYLAGVMEYLIAEMLDTAVTHAASPRSRLEADHILDALLRDAELKKIFPPIGEATYRDQDSRTGENSASYFDVVKNTAKSVLLQTKRVFSFTQGNLG